MTLSMQASHPTACAVVYFLLAVCRSVGGAKVILFPSSISSHVTYFAKLGLGLVSEGDAVTMVTGSHVRIPQWARDSGMTLIQYKVAASAPFSNSDENSRAWVKYAFSTSLFESVATMRELTEALKAAWISECEAMMADRKLVEHVTHGGYEFAVMDTAAVECGYALPYALGLPYASLSLLSLPWLYRVPALPSFYPSMLTSYSDQMTFTQRLASFLAEATFAALPDSGCATYSRKYAPGRPPVGCIQMMRRSELWLVLYDVAMHYPAPLMPNVVAIGDMLTSPARALPDELEQFVQSAAEGVIVVSFGSFLDHIPREIITKLCQAFDRVPQKVVWKLKQREWCVSEGKVLAMDWLPQNDLLGHAKVKLFLTHAGISSLAETLYHAVPAICAPICLDQPSNAQLVTSRGYGDVIDISSFTVDELVEKMRRVVNDPEIRRNLERGSDLLRNKPDTPSRRASLWINRVVQYGSKELRSGAFELNEFQFYMFDIYLFLTFVMSAGLVLLVCCCYGVCKCCKGQCNRRKEKAEKVKTS